MSRIEQDFQDFQDFQDYSVVTVGRGPVPRHASVEETALVGVRFSRRSNDRGGNPLGCACGIRGPPRYGMQGRLRFTVGRGPVPRRASVGETALVGVRFSRRSNDRGGQAPALRYAGPSPFTVGRGPVPRHASVGETAFVCVRFPRGSSTRGGQAPALR